ncbi:hypothetical protein EK904_010801 [Melospiza melodia maxima]|nr:hypothetical protein EK904_010801 [Melospiza melodia maxima]
MIRFIKIQEIFITDLSVARPLSASEQINYLKKIKLYIEQQKYDEAISLCKTLINLALEGLSYYHTYDRLFLGLSIAVSFVGWTTYVILVIIKAHTNLTKTVPANKKVFSFFYRSALTVGLLVFAGWPVITQLWIQAKTKALIWTLLCVLLAIFPLMPVVGREPNIPLV